MDKNVKRLLVTDMDLKGRGIGRQDGKAVFVSGAVIGDSVEYETVSDKKRYDIGRVTRIVSLSEYRTENDCPTPCGGCVFREIQYEKELEIKSRAVTQAYRRAGMGDVAVSKIIKSHRDGYRNKAVLHLLPSGRYGLYDGESHTGSGTECLLFPEKFGIIANKAADFFTCAPKSIMLRANKDGDIMAVFETDDADKVRKFASCASLYSAYVCSGYPTHSGTVYTHVSGEEYLHDTVGRIGVRISPASFFQVNREVAAEVYEVIAGYLAPKDGDLILDVYSGIGTIGLTVAAEYPGIELIGNEIVPEAVEDARRNAEECGIGNARFVCADASSPEFAEAVRGRSPYAVIVDPPRFGLTDTVIREILSLAPEKIVYMSCDPGTLAGDSVKLCEKYEIRDVALADMFPACPHVETVVLFERKSR